MLEAHYGVPMTGAVLHSINTRLDAPVVAFMLDHADTKVLIVDTEFAPILKEALAADQGRSRSIIDYRDLECGVEGERLGDLDYEEFLAAAIPTLPGRCRPTNGTPSRSTIRAARPAIPRASSIIIAARR